MNEKKWFLREDVYFEPLFNHWYAWPYLLPPATAARHTVKTHLRIMKSFVNNHELHMIASKETALAGGEFLDCNEEQLETIKNHITHIEENLSDVIELCEAINALEELLRSHSSGKSIDYLYKDVPQILRGYVEIFLDTEHRAGYRFLEPLMYRSGLYKENLQSLSFGLLSRIGERPFVLSTPRLADENHLQVQINFNHPAVDRIMRAREYPLSSAEIEEIFSALPLKGGVQPRELFIDKPTRYPHRPVTDIDGIRLEYIGHAGFFLQTSEVAILIDPFISNRGESYESEVCSFSELPARIDCICLTHNHQDHVSVESLLQLRYKTDLVLVPKNNGGSLVDPSIRLLLKQFGFNTVEVEDLDEIFVGHAKVMSIPFLGEHGDLNIRSKTGWLIEVNGKKMYFGADSSNPDESLYQHLNQILSGVDIFAIGMECVGAPYTWLYGALHTKMVPKAIKDSRRLNGSDFIQAKKMVEIIEPRRVFIYALGREPWYKYFMGIEYGDDSEQIVQSEKLLRFCEDKSIPAKCLFGREEIWL